MANEPYAFPGTDVWTSRKRVLVLVPQYNSWKTSRTVIVENKNEVRQALTNPIGLNGEIRRHNVDQKFSQGLENLDVASCMKHVSSSQTTVAFFILRRRYSGAGDLFVGRIDVDVTSLPKSNVFHLCFFIFRDNQVSF